jgi:hypothetical protein
MEPKITKAEITAMPKSFADPMPKINVTLDDSSAETLFEFYPDELSFTADEFIGLTVAEGRRLKFTKDKAYLQSDVPAGAIRKEFKRKIEGGLL